MAEVCCAEQWQLIRATLLATLQDSCEGELDCALLLDGRRAILISVMPDPKLTFGIILDVQALSQSNDIPAFAREFLYQLRLTRGRR